MKYFLYILLTLVILFPLSAQSLLDNPDYKKSLEYKELYQDAMENGEYDKAVEYAQLASEHASKSDEYVNMMIARYRANQTMKRLYSRLNEIRRFGGDKTDPEVFSKGEEGYLESERLFTNAEYTESLEVSSNALDMLKNIHRSDKITLAAEYVVRLIPGNRDCLWKIAGYPFVYNDPTAWRLLYNANKSDFPQADNPDLIHPGMILSIPERDGEKRSGRWQEGEIK